MSDPEELHDGVDVCPNQDCRAIEAYEDGRCTECHYGVCRSCLSENVLVNKDGRCDDCGGNPQWEMK